MKENIGFTERVIKTLEDGVGEHDPPIEVLLDYLYSVNRLIYVPDANLFLWKGRDDKLHVLLGILPDNYNIIVEKFL